jgi:hypothetical protein
MPSFNKKEDIKKQIIKDYTNDKAWSYGGINQIYDSFKGLISKSEIKDILAEIDVYTSFKRRKKSKKFSPIYVFKRRELWQIDTVFFNNKNMVKANSGMGYLLTIIDCFTKMAWCIPMKQANCQTAMQIFADVIEKWGAPSKLNSDRGSELICKKFQDFLKKKKIKHYVAYSLRKCAIVERFNLTIQNLLYRMMAKNHTYNWTNFLEQALHIYRNRRHKTVKMSPKLADTKENEVAVRSNLIDFFHNRGIKKNLPKFKINDTVRINRHKNAFNRGYNEDNTEEYFIITNVDNNLPGEVRYKLKDSGDEPIIGSHFENELVAYKPSIYFDIQVIDEKGKGRAKRFLIAYVGYPAKFNEWVTEDRLKKLT